MAGDSPAVWYLGKLPTIREVARKCGYAIGLHGSLNRDMDLIAAPWVEDAVSPEELARAIEKAVDGVITEDGTKGGRYDPVTGKFVEAIIRQPEQKPHGRLAWSIQLGGGTYIDLSVTPLSKEN